MPKLTRAELERELRDQKPTGLERNHYLVSARLGGSIEVSVFIRDIILLGERKAVAHEAWIKMFQAYSTRRVLQSMCERHGVEYTKMVFERFIEFDSQRRRV